MSLQAASVFWLKRFNSWHFYYYFYFNSWHPFNWVVEEERSEKMASVSISGLRRNIKNVAHNYTDAQVWHFKIEPLWCIFLEISLFMHMFAKKYHWRKLYYASHSLQVKVREATSNDPWGPSSTQMSEIADLTYNMVSSSPRFSHCLKQYSRWRSQK